MKIPVLLPNIFNHPFTYDDRGLNLKKGDYVEIPFGKKNKIGTETEKIASPHSVWSVFFSFFSCV